MGAPRASVVWFKRDLRTIDHRPLVEAARRGPVIPLLVIEPELWGEPDVSHRQYVFMRACAQELDEALQRLGARLIVRVGRTTDVLADLKRQFNFADLWSHEETGNAWTFRRDRDVGAWCRANAVTWHEIPQNGVVRRLKNRDGWAEHWDRQMARAVTGEPEHLALPTGVQSEPLPRPETIGLCFDGCSAPQPGGRKAGLETLASFLAWRAEPYRQAMSSPISGEIHCSRLSPYLAWGALSMREVAQAVWRRQRDLMGNNDEQARAWRASLRSFMGRLHWHCHFMQKLETEPSIETIELHPQARRLRPRPADPRLLAAWARGETGYPFLDACMRSLLATGWINFRMRAMLVSFASYNLWLPWQETGPILARAFTDYEPGIHWPQMQMQSGTTGMNTIRLYNPIKQGYDQDQAGAFVRRWVPELAHVPDGFLHEPWTWPGSADLIGQSYPARVVDFAVSAKAAKDQIFAARRQAGFRDETRAIVRKHGSRKVSGHARRASRSRSQKATQPADQFELDL